MADKKLRVFKLKSKKPEELTAELEKYKEELNQLRVSKVAGSTATKLGKIKVMPLLKSEIFSIFQVFRKAIAKYLTVINQNLRTKVAEDLKKKHLKPLDLRVKKTRSIRRRLTRHQRGLKSLRQIKKIANFPQRKYALKE